MAALSRRDGTQLQERYLGCMPLRVRTGSQEPGCGVDPARVVASVKELSGRVFPWLVADRSANTESSASTWPRWHACSTELTSLRNRFGLHRSPRSCNGRAAEPASQDSINGQPGERNRSLCAAGAAVGGDGGSCNGDLSIDSTDAGVSGKARSLVMLNFLQVLVALVLMFVLMSGASSGLSAWGTSATVTPLLIFFLLLRCRSGRWASDAKIDRQLSRTEDASMGADPMQMLWGCLIDEPLQPAGTSATAADGPNGVERAPREWIDMNPSKPTFRQSEFSTVKACGLVRPTHKPHMNYPFAWHFAGKKRLWEFRMQIQFHKIPEELLFGIEIDSYSPMSSRTRMAYSLLKRLVFSYFGSGFYHSPGDDPSKTIGECEPPTFAVPLWGFDQVIVSPKGEEPDILGSLEGRGWRRTDGFRRFKSNLSNLVENLSTDVVYTFCFWGPSRFADIIRWELSGLPGGLQLSIDQLAGPLPFTMVVYDLAKQGPGEDGKTEKRHLRSRKRYYTQAAVWHEAFCEPPPNTVRPKLQAAVQ